MSADTGSAEPTIYRFSTFQEMFDRVPSDKLRLCMDEMGKALATGKATLELIEATARHLAGQAGESIPPTVTRLPEELEWIDDGKGAVGADINLNGEKFLRFDITKATPAPARAPEEVALRSERDDLFDLAWNLRTMLLDYERNVDDEAPPKHREFMARARELLNCSACQGFGDDGEATCQKCGGTGMRHHPLDNPTVALHAEVASLTARLDKALQPARGPEEAAARVAVVITILACEQKSAVMVSLAKALKEVPEPDAALALPDLCRWAADGADEQTRAALDRAAAALGEEAS